jgi:hypothetical protein
VNLPVPGERDKPGIAVMVRAALSYATSLPHWSRRPSNALRRYVNSAAAPASSRSLELEYSRAKTPSAFTFSHFGSLAHGSGAHWAISLHNTASSDTSSGIVSAGILPVYVLQLLTPFSSVAHKAA